MKPVPFAKAILSSLRSAAALTTQAQAADVPKISSPDGKLSVSIQSTNGLTYSIDLDGAPFLRSTPLPDEVRQLPGWNSRRNQ